MLGTGKILRRAAILNRTKATRSRIKFSAPSRPIHIFATVTKIKKNPDGSETLNPERSGFIMRSLREIARISKIVLEEAPKELQEVWKQKVEQVINNGADGIVFSHGPLPGAAQIEQWQFSKGNNMPFRNYVTTARPLLDEQEALPGDTVFYDLGDLPDDNAARVVVNALKKEGLAHDYSEFSLGGLKHPPHGTDAMPIREDKRNWTLQHQWQLRQTGKNPEMPPNATDFARELLLKIVNAALDPTNPEDAKAIASFSIAIEKKPWRAANLVNVARKNVGPDHYGEMSWKRGETRSKESGPFIETENESDTDVKSSWRSEIVLRARKSEDGPDLKQVKVKVEMLQLKHAEAHKKFTAGTRSSDLSLRSLGLSTPRNGENFIADADICLVAMSGNGSIVGELRLIFTDEGKKVTFARLLLPEFQSRGLGTQLLNRAIEFCKLHLPEVEEIWGETLQINRGARESAKKLGFKESTETYRTALHKAWGHLEPEEGMSQNLSTVKLTLSLKSKHPSVPLTTPTSGNEDSRL